MEAKIVALFGVPYLVSDAKMTEGMTPYNNPWHPMTIPDTRWQSLTSSFHQRSLVDVFTNEVERVFFSFLFPAPNSKQYVNVIIIWEIKNKQEIVCGPWWFLMEDSCSLPAFFSPPTQRRKQQKTNTLKSWEKNLSNNVGVETAMVEIPIARAWWKPWED